MAGRFSVPLTGLERGVYRSQQVLGIQVAPTESAAWKDLSHNCLVDSDRQNKPPGTEPPVAGPG